MEQLGEAQPRRGVLVVELKAMIKDSALLERRWTRTTAPGCRQNGQESPGGQGQTAEDSDSRESHEGASDQAHKGRLTRDNRMQQSTPKGSDYLGFGKHGAKKYQQVLKLHPEYCRWTDQEEDPQSHWTLKRFASWLRMQKVL